MQPEQLDDLGFCPSFNCYSSDSLASTAAGRISCQLLEQHADGEEFEFSLGDEVVAAEDIASDGRTVFPLFNRELLNQNSEVDRETGGGKPKLDEEEIAACSNSLEKLFINEREESASSSSSEADESEDDAPGVFCVWRHNKMEAAGSSPLRKCKKSSSTGSGSKRWRIRDLLRRSNSEGKEPIPRQKLNSGEAAGKSKPSIHEFFYVQQRARREVVKRKSYLPYRQGLVGFFSNVNSKGKKSLF
ncbi:hypothetical protein SSX86_008128 [Deinandra increscens subsp. villosa]|uniref:Uncharacterized protein n=1 Tax=Deinandra increscens subsp. villosa TaxID=3103831 RepID=A0AAP0H3T1_9ASTR